MYPSQLKRQHIDGYERDMVRCHNGLLRGMTAACDIAGGQWVLIARWSLAFFVTERLFHELTLAVSNTFLNFASKTYYI